MKQINIEKILKVKEIDNEFELEYAEKYFTSIEVQQKLNLGGDDKPVYSKCGCGGNLVPTEDGLVCDICG